MGSRPVGIVGLGYEGWSIEEFLDDLSIKRVSLVVDVRLTPLSRKKGFSKRGLSAVLADQGVGYEHHPALGNPKWNRAGFAGPIHDLETARRVFAERLQDSEAIHSLDSVADRAKYELVGIMCFERDQQRCHRSVIIDHLAARASLAIV